VLPIKRKFNSAIWLLKKAASSGYHYTVKLFVEALTEKYWLLDYLPTFIKRKEGVLLVRLDLIGDFVLWLDSAQAYRRLYPKKPITLIVNSTCAELASTLPHWDTVIGVNVQRLRTDFGYRLCTLIKLRWRNFAIAIQPTFSREFVGDLTLRSTNASERIGYTGDTNNIPFAQKVKSDRWYSRLIVNEPACTMELNINAHFVRELGCINFLSRVPVIPQSTTLKTNLRIDGPYIVIAPGASWQPKTWPISHFAELTRKLNLLFDVHFVLCGGKDDRVICEQLAQDLNLINLTNLAGQTSLLELVEVVRGAMLVVSNDSSPVHIAAATNTPSVCILGGGHYGRFLPYLSESGASNAFPSTLTVHLECFGCNWKCPFLRGSVVTVTPCISNVSIDGAAQRCIALLPPDIRFASNVK
jgi:ADP-heptose:LPS heptosyltransferase